jgi:hypothetical protein
MSETVNDYLFGPCSRSLLSELADEKAYWAKADSFVMENLEVAVDKLSTQQRIWLSKIKADLLSEAERYV